MCFASLLCGSGAKRTLDVMNVYQQFVFFSLLLGLIRLGKKKDLSAYRAALAFITKESVVKKLFDTIAPSFADKNGGYTEIYKLGARRGDGAEMAVIKLANFDIVKAEEDKKAAKAKKAEEAAKKAEEAEKKSEDAAE